MSASQSSEHRNADLTEAFQGVAPKKPARQQRKYPPPFSLRLTESERIRLAELAGSRPWGAYIRERVFGETSKRKAARRPSMDEQKLAQVLAILGKTRISANLNQIARAANAGVLDTSLILPPRFGVHSSAPENAGRGVKI